MPARASAASTYSCQDRRRRLTHRRTHITRLRNASTFTAQRHEKARMFSACEGWFARHKGNEPATDAGPPGGPDDRQPKRNRQRTGALPPHSDIRVVVSRSTEMSRPPLSPGRCSRLRRPTSRPANRGAGVGGASDRIGSLSEAGRTRRAGTPWRTRASSRGLRHAAASLEGSAAHPGVRRAARKTSSQRDGHRTV